MERVGPRGFTRLFRAAVALACILTASSTRAWAATASGTVITNTASAVFTDVNNTASTTTSNTLSTTVQNAPALTVGTSNQSVTIGMVVVDTFTLTNVGNGTGSFALPGNATFAGTAAGTTLQGYVLNAATTGTCSNADPCAYAILNAQSGMSAAPAGSVTVGVEYTISVAASLGQTIQITLPAAITNIAVNGIVAESSATSTATPTDTIVADARLDVAASVTPPPNGAANITWTVSANDGGGFAAHDLQAAKAVLGAGANGIVLFAKIPTFANGGSLLAVAPTVSTCPSGSTCTVYYNTTVSTAPTTGWSSTQPGTLSTTTWVALFISGGGGGVELVSAPGGSTGGAGNVTIPQASFTFATTQPSGAGAGTAGAVTLIVNGAIGGQLGMTNVTPIVGTSVAPGTADNAGASALSGVEFNSTAGSGTTAPGGSSNIAASQAYVVYSVFIGPAGQAQASGAWSGSTVPGYTTGTATTNNDFSFFDYNHTATSINTATNPAGAPSGNSITGGTAVDIVGTILNAGTGSDSFNLTATTVAAWTVTFQCYNAVAAACGVGDAQFACHVGNITATPSVASAGTYNICATLTPSGAATAYSALAWMITATSVNSGGTVNNTTYDVLYPGGELVGFRSNAVSLCPGGVTPANGGAISGCTITYTVTMVNEAPVIAAGGGANNASATSTSVTVTENGAASGNSWAANTNGLTGTPTISGCTGCSTSGITGSTNFTVTIPTLGPQGVDVYSYAVIVK